MGNSGDLLMWSVEGAKLSSVMQRQEKKKYRSITPTPRQAPAAAYLDQVDLVLGAERLHQLHVHGLVTVGSEGAEVGLAPAEQQRRYFGSERRTVYRLKAHLRQFG